MYEVEKTLKDLKEKLGEYRYNHCLNVASISKSLAEIYNVDPTKAYITGLLHDIAKEFTEEENKYYLKKYHLPRRLLKDKYKKILHSYIGACYVKDVYNMDDDVVNAVKYHTTASPKMDMLSKIVFVADKIDPNKKYPGIEEERRLAYENIDAALKLCLENNIKKLANSGKKPHKDTLKTLKMLKKLDI